MKHKKQFKKKTYRKKNYKKKSKKEVWGKGTVVSYIHRGPDMAPLPMKYRTVLNANIDYVLAAGSGGHTSWNFYVGQNYCFTPFAGIVGSSFATDWVQLFGAAPAPGVVQPAGLSQLISAANNITALYNAYRVFASSIKITVGPAALSDAMLVSVTPSTTGGVPVSVYNAQGQPYSKEMVFRSATPGVQYTSGSSDKATMSLKNHIASHKFLGCTKRAYEDDLSDRFSGFSSINGSLPTDQFHWTVNMIQANGAVTGAAMTCQIAVRYFVEFFNKTYPNLPLV